MVMVYVDGSSLQADSQPKLDGLVWLRVSGHLALSLRLPNEPGKPSQWLQQNK